MFRSTCHHHPENGIYREWHWLGKRMAMLFTTHSLICVVCVYFFLLDDFPFLRQFPFFVRRFVLRGCVLLLFLEPSKLLLHIWLATSYLSKRNVKRSSRGTQSNKSIFYSLINHSHNTHTLDAKMSSFSTFTIRKQSIKKKPL